MPPEIPPNRRANPSALPKLLQLDAAIRPGLTQAHFHLLFVRCTCGLVMTRRAYPAHYCVKEPEVVELTDIDDSEMEPDVIELTDIDDSETEMINLTTATDDDDEGD